MTIEEIRKNAPSGATHYYEWEDEVFYIMYNRGAELTHHYSMGWVMMDYPDYDEPDIKPL